MSEFDDIMYDSDLENTEEETEERPGFENQSDLYGKKIKPVPKPEIEIGIDRTNSFTNNIIGEGDSGSIDISKINSFTQISSNRDTVYSLLDVMAEDPMIASALEIYTEDVTETNDKGQIVWCEADNPEIGKLVTYFLDSMNVDKNIYEWAHSFIKYGDLYLRLYRQSDLANAGLADNQYTNSENDRQYLNEELDEKKELNEDVILKLYKDNDPYIHYIEMMPNPAEMFELTKFGKTFAYIQAEIPVQQQKETGYMNTYYKYSFKSNDVNVYQPTSFVHACLKDNTTRSPEEVDLSVVDSQDRDKAATYTYNVKRGQSILYNTFKIWREMTLLENSMLLNRLTKSSIVRLMNVEVGDMPKEEIGPHLAGIKRLIEQKTALNTGNYMEEYTNPGPVENYVYVPTHNGLGAISSEELGGDTSVKGLEDVDYFKNKLMGSLKIPGQYLGFTDDNTGFNGGTALSIVSSRYAKTVKRIQNHLIQAITDIINLMLIDKRLDNYINKFTIRMQEPTTQEEIDRKESKSTSVGIVSDILNLLDGLQKESSKLKALKILLSTVVSDSEITDIIQEEIEMAEKEEDSGMGEESEDMFDGDMDLDLGGGHSGMHVGGGDFDEFGDEGGEDLDFGEEEAGGEEAGADNLPTPDELGAGDFTDNTAEF